MKQTNYLRENICGFMYDEYVNYTCRGENIWTFQRSLTDLAAR
jgi:hypothetical protein